MNKLKRDAGLARIQTEVVHDPPTFFPALADDDRPVPTLTPANASARPPGFHFPGIDDFTRAYREGRTTPEQIAERFIAQREQSERDAPGLRAFIAIDRDDVIAQAKASGARWRAGAPLGAFDGVPVAIKDELDQAGYPTTAGTCFIGSEARDRRRDDCRAAARRGRAARRQGEHARARHQRRPD